jgi:RNA polymerase sigma-70 factor (ECF subfamily)
VSEQTQTEDAPAGQALHELSDAELVRAYREGNIHAFEELHRRYVSSIYRLVRRKLGDGLLAEDIAQETFLKSLRTMDRVDESFNFGGWVHTVARNLCFDELRRRQRDQRADDTDGREALVSLPAPALRSDPAIAHEGAELRRQLWEVAQRLPEKYRLVLTLRELQGLSYRQIGRTMKISESAVETLLYRARLRFKEEFIAAEGGTVLSCEEVVPLLAPYVAGKLRRGQAELVRQHVATCVKCAKRVGPEAVGRARRVSGGRARTTTGQSKKER